MSARFYRAAVSGIVGLAAIAAALVLSLPPMLGVALAGLAAMCAVTLWEDLIAYRVEDKPSEDAPSLPYDAMSDDALQELCAAYSCAWLDIVGPERMVWKRKYDDVVAEQRRREDVRIAEDAQRKEDEVLSRDIRRMT